MQADYFEQLYTEKSDPWDYQTSAYEQMKYDATIDALPSPRIDRALEVGCSIGVMTRRLADRCDQLVAVDFSATALAQARQACADQPHVRFARMQVPRDWPDGSFDLILISEVLYYLTAADIRRTAAACRRSLAPGGSILLVHYLLPAQTPCTGDEATEIFCAALDDCCALATRSRSDQFRLDLLRPADAVDHQRV